MFASPPQFRDCSPDFADRTHSRVSASSEVYGRMRVPVTAQRRSHRLRASVRGFPKRWIRAGPHSVIFDVSAARRLRKLASLGRGVAGRRTVTTAGPSEARLPAGPAACWLTLAERVRGRAVRRLRQSGAASAGRNPQTAPEWRPCPMRGLTPVEGSHAESENSALSRPRVYRDRTPDPAGRGRHRTT